jgi:hypothetical protein
VPQYINAPEWRLKKEGIMNTKYQRMNKVKNMIALSILSLVGLFATAAKANQIWYSVINPATMCTAFGNTAVGPNGGAEIVNWSETNTALINCPIQRDGFDPLLVNMVHFYMHGGLTGYPDTTCALVAQERNGAGWRWNPDLITVNNNDGFEDLYFQGRNVGNPNVAVGIECVVRPWGTINSYLYTQVSDAQIL